MIGLLVEFLSNSTDWTGLTGLTDVTLAWLLRRRSYRMLPHTRVHQSARARQSAEVRQSPPTPPL